MTSTRLFFGLWCVAAVVAYSYSAIYDSSLPIDHPAIRYSDGVLDDPVARLAARLESGQSELTFNGNGLGYLPSLLEQLGIPADSQALVFSKTSLQAARISPRNPRAVYFADDVALGFVRGGDAIELASLDPRQGVVFYTLDSRRSERPRFLRTNKCLECHQGPATAGVPGFFVSSVFPNTSGMPDRSGAIVTDHRTAFQERWGGWYVNGTHGDQRHRGNAVARNPATPDVLETEGTQNLTTLAWKFDTAGYLAPVSDLIALMTFEHQTQMVNLMTRTGWLARIAGQERDLAADAALESSIRELTAYMLFADEAVLQEPVQGVSSFTKTFPQQGPRDRRGRSLRDFDLQRRLFRYPLSYMVYSAAFDGMPPRVRERIYARLYEVLTGKDRSAAFSRLSEDDRRSILEILLDTKPNLPAYWREAEIR